MSQKGYVLDGMVFPEGTTELVANLFMFGKGVERKEEGKKVKVSPEDRLRYLKRAIDLAFNCEGSIRNVIWNDWTDKILAEMVGDWSKKRLLGIAGCSSCVSGDTRLLDPLTGKQVPIKELTEKGIRPWVQTLNGPVLADVPYLKGRAELFEFKLSNGESFKCTGEHRLLIESGWQFSNQISVGDWIYGYAPSHPQTTLGIDPLVREQDALHCSKTIEGSQSDCHSFGNFCDAQLLQARESARELLPLQDDVQKYNECVSERLDGLCGELEHIHPCQLDDLSKRNVFRHTLLLAIAYVSHYVRETFSLPSLLSRQRERSHSDCVHLFPSEGQFQNSHHKQHRDCDGGQFLESLSRSPSIRGQQSLSLSPSHQQQAECFLAFETIQRSLRSSQQCVSFSSGLKASLVQVESITSVGFDDFYDLNVPVEHHYFAEGAVHHNSGKSDAVALYGLMEYWARPSETFFIVMSTTKLSARMRIWKSITQFWGQASRMGCPGKLIDSDGYIKGVDELGNISRNSGIILMAAGKADAEEASKELLGIKNPNVVIGADEDNELGDGILKTVYENMTSNDRLNFSGMANPDKLTDTFADLCEPVGGFKTITEADYEWKTKYGKCIRFDAEQSPRIMEEKGFTDEERAAGKVSKFFWQPDQGYCDRIADNRGGKRSRGYFRFVKAFWCPDGSANSIYSEAEFMSGCALDDREPQWDSNPVTLGGLDPAFSRGGDRSQSAYAKVGTVNSRDHLHVVYEQAIEEDIRNKSVTLTHQTVRGWKKLSEEWGVKPIHAIMDSTGAGTPFGHVVDAEWSSAVQKVNFKGKASDRTVIFRNQDCKFYNKNSELWIQPKEFIRSNQISGISKELMAELVEREYHDKESSTLRVESKEDAKKRLKRSPDRADAFLLLVEKAVTMGYFKSEEVKRVSKMIDKGWMKARDKRSLTSTCGKKFRR